MNVGREIKPEPGPAALATPPHNGTVPVTLAISGILPECYGDFNDTILADAPRCDGNSGRSKREPVPPCP